MKTSPINRPISAALIERLVGGVSASGTETFTAIEVFSGAPLAELPQSSIDDVSAAVARARAAQPAWQALGTRARTAIVRKFLTLLRSETETVLDLLQAETGKARWDAVIECLEPSLTLGYYTRKGASILRDRRREGMVPMFVRTIERRQPKGVVGVIAPWNYPFALAVSDAVTAVIAGNTVVLKPDNQTALTTLFAAELLAKAGLPPDILQIVAGDGETVGRALVDRADYVAFTGSTRTGFDVAQRTASRLVGCTLELGGKNSMLILEDANVSKAVAGAIAACFMHAGQVCMAIEKIVVHRSIYDQFLAAFSSATASLELANSYDFVGDVGSLTSLRHLGVVESFLDDAKVRGASVVVGGRSRPDVGPMFFEPTILTGVTEEMRCATEEVFGPVVAIYPFDSEDEAVAMANAGEFGLNASIYTRDTRRGRAIATKLRAGTVNINEGLAAAYGSMGATAGGMGKSGLGRRHGPEGLLKYTEAQTIAVQSFALQAPPQWVPKKKYQQLFGVGLAALARLHIR